MTARLRFFGTQVVSLTGPAHLVATMVRLWAPFAVAPDAAPGGASHVDVPVADLATACADVNRRAVAACPFPAAHAAVVALSGAGVAVPGVSGAGKSTLAAAAARAGAGYVSDEALVIDDDGRCVPYPKPLALSGWSVAAVTRGGDGPWDDHLGSGGEHLVAPVGSGFAVPTRPVRLAHVVLPHRGPGISGAAITELPRREGLAALLTLSFNHYRDPGRYLVAAGAAVSGARVWRLEYADPAVGVRTVIDALG